MHRVVRGAGGEHHRTEGVHVAEHLVQADPVAVEGAVEEAARQAVGLPGTF